MRNIILAIVAVFCLQLCFQVYSAIDRGRDEFIAMNAADPVSGLPVGQTDAAQIPEGDIAPSWWFAATPGRVRTVRHAAVAARPAPTLIAAKRDYIRPRSITVKDTPSLKQMPAKITSTESRPFNADLREPDRKKSKPLFVKIVKKPYDWLKAVGGLFH